MKYMMVSVDSLNVEAEQEVSSMTFRFLICASDAIN